MRIGKGRKMCPAGSHKVRLSAGCDESIEYYNVLERITMYYNVLQRTGTHYNVLFSVSFSVLYNVLHNVLQNVLRNVLQRITTYNV